MTIVRWEPLRELSTLQSDMNRLFSSAFDPQSHSGYGEGGRRWIPSMDLVETAEDYVLRADLPGVRQDDVRIEVENDVLTIMGERKAEQHDSDDGFVRLERAFGAFSRSLALPQGVDAEGVTAAFADGVLELHIPKPEQAKPRRIEIALGDRPATVEGTAA